MSLPLWHLVRSAPVVLEEPEQSDFPHSEYLGLKESGVLEHELSHSPQICCPTAAVHSESSQATQKDGQHLDTVAQNHRKWLI